MGDHKIAKSSEHVRVSDAPPSSSSTSSGLSEILFVHIALDLADLEQELELYRANEAMLDVCFHRQNAEQRHLLRKDMSLGIVYVILVVFY
jgi:hypothetical protein